LYVPERVANTVNDCPTVGTDGEIEVETTVGGAAMFVPGRITLNRRVPPDTR
jgi:hypothetical protein